MTYATDVAARGDLTERLLGTVARIATAARTRHARRRVYRATFAELAGLNNRELADVGLTRGDIKRVSREAAWAAVPA
ncbi:MAG: DUF1127 domain-containing protein [Pseudomonadota bacterium]